MKRRVLSCLLALVMAFSLLPASALAANATVKITEGSGTDYGANTHSVTLKQGTPAGTVYYGQNSNGGTISKSVDESGIYKVLPVYPYGRYHYTPTDYMVTADSVTVDQEGIIGDLSVSLVQGIDSDGHRHQCIQFGFTALRAGTVTVTLKYYYNFGLPNVDTKWYLGTATCKIKVTGSSADKPDKPTEKDIASFAGNVGNVSGVSVALFCDSGEEDHTSLYTISNDGNHNLDYWGHYTLGDVVENPGTLGINTTAYPYVCPMTIDASGFLVLYNSAYESEVGTHALAAGQENPVVYWFWDKTDKIWKYKGSDAPVKIKITCEQDPDAGQLDTAIAAVEVQVACASETTHTPAKYPIGSNAKIEKQVNGGTATITLTAPADYASLYQAGGKTHTYDEKNTGNRLTFTMKWKKNATNVWGWYLEGDAPQIMTTCTSTPEDATLTIVKKVSSKLDEDADFTFTLKRYILSANPSGSEALYTEDRTFSHEPIVVHVAKGSDTGSAMVDLPEIPVSTVYTVEEENPTSELKMEGTTGVFSKAEYEGKMSCPDISQEIVTSNSFSTLWPGQEITSVTITCTNTYELTAPAKYPVTVKNSYAASTGAGNYVAGETVTIHAGSRNNYSFDGWTINDRDVTLANANKADTTFTMPNHAVTVTASWTYTDSSHDDDDDEDTYYFAVKKVDAQDNHTLNGAKFGLYLDGKQIATATSNRSGIAMFRIGESDYRKITAKSDLYYQELTAPEGYVVSGDEASIEKNDLKTNQTTAEKNAETVRNYRSSTPELLNDSDHFAYVIGYEDGLVKPYGPITRAETTTIFFRLLKDSVRDGNLLTSNTYTDVPDDYWANTAISTMTGLGIVQGRSTTTFDPKAPITRAQFAAICARFDTGKSNGEQTFSDIQGHWAEKYIERAAELGWIKGFEDGTFRPDTYITRAQAMTMINRVLNRIPEDESDLLPGMNVWPDCNPGDWFYLAVQEATNSHDFKHKAGNYETWTGMNKNPDWTRYEH